MTCSDASFTHAKQMSGLESLCSSLLCKKMASLPQLLVTVTNGSTFFLPCLQKYHLLKCFLTEHPRNTTFITGRNSWLGAYPWWSSTCPSVGPDGHFALTSCINRMEKDLLWQALRECPVLSALFSTLYPAFPTAFPAVSLPQTMVLSPGLC